MTFPTREDRANDDFRDALRTSDEMLERWHSHSINRKREGEPRLDWLLLTVLVADLGVWVGLLAWWIWR